MENNVRKRILVLFSMMLMLCVVMFGVTACDKPIDPPHTHTFDKQVVKEIYLKKSATCTEKAEYYYSCSCGEKGDETFEKGKPLGHKYDTWTSNGDGTHTGFCVYDISHTITKDCTGSLATCTKKSKCNACGAEFGDLKAHVYNQDKVEEKYLKSEATCETKAVYYYSCVCGEKGADTFEYGSVLEHNYQKWTSNGDGTHKSICLNDSKHVLFQYCNGGTSTCVLKAVCADCGGEYGDLKAHVYNQDKVEEKYLKSPATQKSKAIYYYSCVCGEKGTEKTFEYGEVLDSVKIDFITNGVSEYAIVIPDSLSLTGTSALSYAVNDLHDYVSLATSGAVDLPIVKASDYKANTYPKYLSIGNTGLLTTDVASDANVDEVVLTLGEDGLFYFSIDEDIFFTGSTNYGVANGIYDFLRTYLGFDAITDNLVVYNENVTNLSFYTIYKIKVPDIAERHINGVDAKTRARYGARNGYMGYNIGGLYNDNFTAWKISSMHNTLDYIPYSTHKAEHGAYWYATDENNAIIGGATPKDVCYTAHGDKEQYQAMVNEYAKIMKEMFVQREKLRKLKENGGYSWTTSEWDTLTIMTEDNGTACNCSSCQETKALYGGYNSGAMIKFVNDVKRTMDTWFNTTEGAKYKMDNFNIMFSAYQKFIDAPVVYDDKTEKYVAVHPDVVPIKGVTLQIATSDSSGLSPYYNINAAENVNGKATIEKWATLVEGINLWTYQANFSNYLYFGDTFELFNEEGYTFFKNNKVTAWVNQNSSGKETSWAALKEYVSSKLMWDTSADLEEIYDNYFDAVYGTASTAMRNLFDMQREAFQDALASYATANPDLSVAGYANIFNGYYDDEKLKSITDGYKTALASIEEGSYAYYQIIKEAISPYFIALTNRDRHGAFAGSTTPAGSIQMDKAELTRIQTLKVEFKKMLDAYEAVYGKMHRTEGTTDLSSDILYNQLGYYFKPSNNPLSLLIYAFDCASNKAGTRAGGSTKTLSAGVHGIGWNYGYPDGKGHAGYDFRNVTIELVSGSDVVELTLGKDKDGNELVWNKKTYMDENGCLPATQNYSARFQLGVINCKKAGTAVLRLHYDLDGMHYTYDLTLTVTN